MAGPGPSAAGASANDPRRASIRRPTSSSGTKPGGGGVRPPPPVLGGAGAGDAAEAPGAKGIEADVHAPEPRLGQRPGMAGEGDAVGGPGDLLDPGEGDDHAQEIDGAL